MTDVLIDGYALADGAQLRGIGKFLTRIGAGLAQRRDRSVKVLADPSMCLPAAADGLALCRQAPAYEAIRQLGLGPDAVHVKHNGVDLAFFHISAELLKSVAA